jgi:hypothetical protein
MYRLALGIDIDYMLFSTKHSVLATVNERVAAKNITESTTQQICKAILDA